ncbi:PEP/pyruvate-binding domain-containing protein [Candidatus Neomarinimicrobiota bacterium]
MLQPKITFTKHLDFQDLMLFRVHEILLIASPYDAFILEEDGRLTEQILHEYLDMNFHYAPRVWQANTASSALQMLTERDFDVVILMLRISDMDTITIGSTIKKRNPEMPLILLALDEAEYSDLDSKELIKYIDKIFIWSGNSNVFPAIMKYIEDERNAYRDIIQGNVRTIIFIEDRPRYYSVILPLIYQEIMFHTRDLVDKSLNVTQRLLHLRSRTKILVADNYENAKKCFDQFSTHVLGIISDIRFPKNGIMEHQAGIHFMQYVRKREPYLPVILQSSDLNRAKQAKEVNAYFLHKKSPTLLQDLREYMLRNFGFGDFVFRSKKGKEIDRASSLQSFREKLGVIPSESLLRHAQKNHFSNWLSARGEFDIATAIRPVYVEDFQSTNDLRKYILGVLDQAMNRTQLKHIEGYSLSQLKQSRYFSRLAGGSIGGKARGLAFMNSIIHSSDIAEKFKNVKIRIPNVMVIGTDEFDTFMKENKLWKNALSLKSNKSIIKLFLKGKLSDQLINNLDELLDEIKYPLAVRSSSIHEDSQYQPLAGLYSTFMLPNSSPKKKERLNQLKEAIKRVYASTYFQEPKSLIESTGLRHEEEKMGVVIMELVGKNHDHLFYPTASGIARNVNYYPVSYMKRNDGYAVIALGFGRTVVEGENALRFSPAYPNILPQFYSIKSTIESSQNSFYALNLDTAKDVLIRGEVENLELYDLEKAEKDGELKWAGSVVSSEDDIIRDSLSYPGVRVVTFTPLLKWNLLPLTDILKELLKIGQIALGNPVEIEFALNLYKNKQSEFCLLQIKPLVIGGPRNLEKLSEYKDTDIICRSSVTLGNGTISDLSHIMLVDPKTFDVAKSLNIAKEIEYFNELLSPDYKYILAGPGRWGTADPWLGIPVEWPHISNAKVIIELGMEEFPVDPSFGSHFFQNIASLRIGYFTISHKGKKDWFKMDRLTGYKVLEKQKYTSLIKLDHPAIVNINGQTGAGIIIDSAVNQVDLMDEQESTGI